MTEQDTFRTLLAHLHRGGAYGYWWVLDEVNTYTITRGPRKGQHEACKRTSWWPVDKPLPLPTGATEHVYFGVHPAAQIPQSRTHRTTGEIYTPKPERTRPLVNEIAAVNCLFAEFDAKDFANGKTGARAHIDRLPLQPSVLIDSGGGYHAYWLLAATCTLTNDNRAQVKDLQNRWAQFVGSDDGAKDLARVLRVPGRPNVKAAYAPDYPMVRFVFADFARLYARDALADAIPAHVTATPEYEQKPFTPTPGDHSAYVQAAYNGEVQAVATALDGQKHYTVRNAAIKLAGLLWTGRITEHEIEDGLFAAIEGRAKDPSAARQTILDGIAYGKARPRTIKDRAPQQRNGTHAPDNEDEGNEGDEAPADENRPTIDRSTLDLPMVMPLAWDAICGANDPPTLFQRAGELARMEATDTGARVVKTIDSRVMLGILARAARWVRVSYSHGERVEKETLPPPAVVDDCMVNIDPRIPQLARVVYAPTFGSDMALLTTPGYHAAARVYYDPKAGAVVPPVPDTPASAELERARSLILDELLIDFPFVSDADRAHAVALLLLPFVRELIAGPTPLHLIEAPTMGSGKGLLADALLLPALGTAPSPMTEATTEEEWGKTITSNLLAAPTVIFIDNLNRKLASGKLAAALTASEFSDRILGKSEQIALPVRCVWVATANNPTLSTEISRRCIRIRIDPRMDKPWQREQFKHTKLRSWIAANRGDLIWAALIICRYGLAHGASGRPLGSYEAWSDVIGRILTGAGFFGFLENLDALYDRADVEGTAWRALIGSWWQQHGSTPQPTSELYPLVAETEADVLISGKDEDGRKKSFGKALARALDRVFSVDTDDGSCRFQVIEDGMRHKTKLWRLVDMEEGGIGGLGGFAARIPARARTVLNPTEVLNYQNPQKPPNPPTQNGQLPVWDGDVPEGYE